MKMTTGRKPYLRVIGFYVIGSSLVLVALGSLCFSYFYRRHDFIKAIGVVDWLEPCFNDSSEEGTLAHIDISEDYFHGCAIYFNTCCSTTNPYVNDCLQVKDTIDVWYDKKTCHYSFDGHLFHSISNNAESDTFVLFEKLWLPPIIELVVGLIFIILAYIIWKQCGVKLQAPRAESTELKLNAFPLSDQRTEDVHKGVFS